MERTVIVVSTPRSGSSWMSRILRAHPELQVYTHNTAHTYMLYMLYPGRTLNPFGDDAVERRAPLDCLLDGLRERAAGRYFGRMPGKGALVLASPTMVEFLPLLARVFPEARYVHLRRNALDVVASFRGFMRYNAETGLAARYRKHRHQGPVAASRAALAHAFHSLRWSRCGERGYVGTRPSGFQAALALPRLEFLCWYYLRLEEQIAAALDALPDARRHEVSYERLVASCEHEIGRLCDFIGVRRDAEHLRAAASGVRPGSVNRHRASFDAGELERIERFVAGLRGERFAAELLGGGQTVGAAPEPLRAAARRSAS